MRESLSLDMIDRLVTDIISVTETLIKSDAVDIAAFQPSAQSVEKSHGNQGLNAKDKHKARNPMHKGVHRTVC